jgi:chromate reductase
MNDRFDVAVLVGSLRAGSFNRKLANVLCRMAPQSLDLEIVEIGDLPLYNQDNEANPPPTVRAFKHRIEHADAILFVTPEYNRSVPAALKNAIDVASRPYGKSAWNGKPCAIISATPGAIGGFGANHHLRQMLVFLNMPALQHEAYIGGIDKLLDADGNLTNDQTKAFLQKFLDAFAAWIERNRIELPEREATDHATAALRQHERPAARH